MGQTRGGARAGNREPGTFLNFPKAGSSDTKLKESVTIYYMFQCKLDEK